MAKKPYRKCQKCGKWVPMKTDTCSCGGYVGSQLPMMLEDTEVIDPQPNEMQLKEVHINETGTQEYVQRCPNCGTDHFVKSKEERLERCPNCGKATIRYVEPTVLKKADFSDENQPSKEETVEIKFVKKAEAGQKAPEQDVSWNKILERLNKVGEAEKILELESIGHFAGFRISLQWKDTPIMVGREAECSEFLWEDQRVSGKHCEFTYEDGNWYIRDNKSTNSTLLNERVVSFETPEKLRTGDSIVLGNQMDSMEFRVVSMK